MINTPTVLVLFGATGDLAAKKILPALFELHKQNLISDQFKIVGFARRYQTNEEFKDHVKNILHESEQLDSFLERVMFVQGDITNVEDFKKVRIKLDSINEQWNTCANRLYYLSVTPRFYDSVFKNISESGLTASCSDEEGWSRIIVEKPFGKDAITARQLEEQLSTLFREEQIYRIDHYLGKDALQNILAFRFTNNLFENSWNNRFIEKIEVTVKETIDVGDRGDFYDGVGALRDVGQNHLLQMLALVTMENPLELRADRVREMRERVFNDLRILSETQIVDKTKRGQYEGYTTTEGVAENSQTETFFKIEAEIMNAKWQGVPIILTSGKAMNEERKEIVVTFKEPDNCICRNENNKAQKNRVVFSIAPDEKIEFHLFAKKAGLDFVTTDQLFSINYDSSNLQAQEYQLLLLDVIQGNQTSFVSSEEVRAMWKFIDPIIEAWSKNSVELKKYPKNADSSYFLT